MESVLAFTFILLASWMRGTALCSAILGTEELVWTDLAGAWRVLEGWSRRLGRQQLSVDGHLLSPLAGWLKAWRMESHTLGLTNCFQVQRRPDPFSSTADLLIEGSWVRESISSDSQCCICVVYRRCPQL